MNFSPRQVASTFPLCICSFQKSNKISLENISRTIFLQYVPNKGPIENFNLQVVPGRHIAIIKSPKCGKTPFIDLLIQFYGMTKEHISVDGKPVTDLSRHTLRKSFGMVLQDTWIKNGTVHENITIGKPDATDLEIIDTTKMSHN